MSLLRELVEQQDRPTVYVYEWSNQDGGNWTSETYDGETFEDVVVGAEDDWDVEGSEPVNGIWVGLTFGDGEFSEDEDEDGKYINEKIAGVLVIVSRQPLAENHPMFTKALKEFQSAAEQYMEEERAAYQDSREYQRDPHSYYGVRRSDFS